MHQGQHAEGRAQGPHEANLFDIDQKYGDVMSLEEVLDELDKLAPKQANIKPGE